VLFSKNELEPVSIKKQDEIVIGLAKGAAIGMFAYFFLKLLIFIHGKQWLLCHDFWGIWYLIEIIGLVLLPCFMWKARKSKV